MLDDVGRLLSRVTLGASIAAHGAQKAWGAFDGPGPQGAAKFMESLGFVPGERYAEAASRTEIVSGLLIALGLGGPLGPAALVSVMVVAQATVHAKNGYFAQKNGIELGVLYATAALAIASAGYGRYSLDEAFGWQKLREPGLTALALAGGVASAFVVLAQRSTVGEPQINATTTTQSHIAAAAEDRPVPADLIVAADDTAAP